MTKLESAKNNPNYWQVWLVDHLWPDQNKIILEIFYLNDLNFYSVLERLPMKIIKLGSITF